MGWNYRVMKHNAKSAVTGEVDEWYAIHEVYYRSEGADDLQVTSDGTGYTVEPVRVYSDDLEGLKWQIQRMLEALDKPVLEYRESEPTPETT